VLAVIAEAVRTKRLFELEHRVRRVDGSVGWTLSRAVPVLDASGEITEWFGAASDITARKQADAAVRESQARRTFVLEAAKIGEWELEVATGQAQHTFVHDQCFGATEPLAEWSYEIFLGYVHPDDRTMVEQTFGTAMEGQTPWTFECRVVWPDTSVHWIAAQGYFYGDRHAHATRMVGMVTDITAHKQADDQVRRAADLDAFRVTLSDALRPLTDPLAIQQTAMRVVGERLNADRVLYAEIGDDGDTITVADNYVRGDFPKIVGRFSASDFGTAKERLRAGQTFITTNAERDERLPMAERAPLRAQGNIAIIAVPLVKNNRWVSNLGAYHVEPYAWTADEVRLVEETAERTWAAVERARAEQALRASEERLRMLIESAHDYAIFTLTPDNRVASWNIGAERIFGYTEREILGQHGAVLFTPDDVAAGKVAHEMQTALRVGRSEDESWRVRQE